MTELEELRLRASNSCLAFYRSFQKENLKCCCEEVVTAWEIGRKINDVIENNKSNTQK